MLETIHLDPTLAQKYGIDASKPLARLESIVAITGPNGAGKTRILNLLAEQLVADRKEFERFVAISTPNHPDRLNAECSVGCSLPEDGASNRAPYLARMKRFVSRYRFLASWRQIRDSGQWPQIVYLDAGQGSRDLPYGTNRKNFREFPRSSLNTFAQALYFGKDPEWLAENNDLHARAVAFASTVKTLIGAEFGIKITGTSLRPTLDGRSAAEDSLSEGQRVLLRWAELVHEEVADFRNAILLIDEPELHLHADALIQAMRQIQGLEPAQIWVATHCVPLLAWIGAKRIYSMDRSRPTWAGNRMDEVLAGLLGATDGTTRLRTFLSDAASLAFHQFVAECLTRARTAPLRENDPQAKLVETRIGRLLTNADRDVLVLEYGSGQGRLIDALSTMPSDSRSRLRYHAYNDPHHTSPADRDSCRDRVALLAGTAFYCEDLREHQLDAAEKMDAVILCNVLHEIPPSTWPKLMESLRACLRPDGHLVIIEDQQMSIGELPHDGGYLVLDRIELCELFGIAKTAICYTDDGRISIAEIETKHLAGCTAERTKRALVQLQKRAIGYVKALRDVEEGSSLSEHQRGRAHGFYAILHTNAVIACESL